MRSWFVHNFFAHPVMALLQAILAGGLGMRVQDAMFPTEGA